MTIVMTLLVRNEADIVDAQIAFHLHAGVDFVIATDNGSQDGTTEILERYASAGRLHLIREDGTDMQQDVWVTRMARLAATEFGADWVLNTDADEFWWPRGGSLKEVLGTIPERFGLMRGCWRHFLPRPEADTFFAERMTVRLNTPAHAGDKSTIYHAHQKVAHRARADIVVDPGNHTAHARGLDILRGWHPIEILHFSLRGLKQMQGKSRGGWHTNPARTPALHQLRLRDASAAGRMDEYFRSIVVDDAMLARGLADGTFAIDTRLRDALRDISTGDGTFTLPENGSPARLIFRRPELREDAIYAAGTSLLAEIDGIVRAESRIDALEARLSQLERLPFARVAATCGRRRDVRGTLRRLAQS